MSRRTELSTLWVFLVLNFLYADVIALFDAVFIGKQSFGSFQFSKGLLFGFSIELEAAMVMVILARMLSARANRWSNFVAGSAFALITLMTQIVIPFANGTATAYYVFFGTIEVVACGFIIARAWTMPTPTAKRSSDRAALSHR